MRKQLRNKEIRELKEFIKEEALKKAKKVEKLEDNDGVFIIFDNEAVLFEYNNSWVYTLKAIANKLNAKDYKNIIVDKGAIKFVASGADIMRPGILKIPADINENNFVIIREETHNKPLAIGCSLFDSGRMQDMNSGKVIKNLHYVSDAIWNKE